MPIARTRLGRQVYKGRQDPNNYDIITLYELGQTYYWRIDEVNDPNIWPGNIWSFTTRNYLVVDDFESYTNSDPNIIYKTWKDGLGYRSRQRDRLTGRLSVTPIMLR